MGSEKLQVQDVMSTELHTLDRNDQLILADQVMTNERMRHMPVLDGDGCLCGIVSQRDIFKSALLGALGYGSHAAEMALKTVIVKEAMTERPHTTTPETLVSDAAATMLAKKIGCLPVVSNDKLVGIITESDLITLVANGTD